MDFVTHPVVDQDIINPEILFAQMLYLYGRNKNTYHHMLNTEFTRFIP